MCSQSTIKSHSSPSSIFDSGQSEAREHARKLLVNRPFTLQFRKLLFPRFWGSETHAIYSSKCTDIRQEILGADIWVSVPTAMRLHLCVTRVQRGMERAVLAQRATPSNNWTTFSPILSSNSLASTFRVSRSSFNSSSRSVNSKSSAALSATPT